MLRFGVSILKKKWSVSNFLRPRWLLLWQPKTLSNKLSEGYNRSNKCLNRLKTQNLYDNPTTLMLSTRPTRNPTVVFFIATVTRDQGCKWAGTHRNGVPVGICAAGTPFLFVSNCLRERRSAGRTKKWRERSGMRSVNGTEHWVIDSRRSPVVKAYR